MKEALNYYVNLRKLLPFCWYIFYYHYKQRLEKSEWSKVIFSPFFTTNQPTWLPSSIHFHFANNDKAASAKRE